MRKESVVSRAVIGCSQDLFRMEKTEYSRKQLSEGEEQHVLSQTLKTSRPAVELTGPLIQLHIPHTSACSVNGRRLHEAIINNFVYFMYKTLPINFHKLLPTLLIP